MADSEADVLAGSAGFTKPGVGTIVIAKPATITGPLTVERWTGLTSSRC